LPESGCISESARIADATGPAGFEIENMARDAVDEGGVHDVEPLAAAEQRGLRRARERRERRDRDLDGLMTRSADCDADPAQQRPRAFLANVRRQVVIGCGHEIAREGASHAFRRCAICVGPDAASVVWGKAGLVAAMAMGTAAAVCIKVRRSVVGISAASSNEAPGLDELGGPCGANASGNQCCPQDGHEMMAECRPVELPEHTKTHCCRSRTAYSAMRRLAAEYMPVVRNSVGLAPKVRRNAFAK
jgi:hypothetical protein